MLLAAALAIDLALSSSVQAACLGMVVHAHRGAATQPENSLSAVRAALGEGADGVEIDLQRLGSGEWVLHHDPVLGRTTSLARRPVQQLDGMVWKEVRLKDRRGRISAEPAPFLSDVLGEFKSQPTRVLNAEIKQMRTDCEQVRGLVAELGRALPDGNWFLTAIERSTLQCARAADPGGYLGQIVLDPRAMSATDRRAMGVSSRLASPTLDRAWLQGLVTNVGLPVGIHVDVLTLRANPGLLADARDAGVAVFTYSLSGDRDHVAALRYLRERSGLVPSGVIIDGDTDGFCTAMGR